MVFTDCCVGRVGSKALERSVSHRLSRAARTGRMKTGSVSNPEKEASGPSSAPDQTFVAPPRRLVMPSLVCVLLAMFLAALSQTVVATLLPLMIADLGGFERYAWAVTSYVVAATVVYPITGRLSDIYGRRRLLIVGMVVFVAGSALVGLSVSMTQVIAFRALQGIGGGLVMTCCYVSIADLFKPEDRGRYQGLYGAVYGVASVAGPVLGGIIAERLSWQWAFMLIALIGLPVLAMTARVYPVHRRVLDDVSLDLPGMTTLVLAVVPILVALSLGGVQYEWAAPQIIGLLAFGLAMIGLFLFLETRAPAPVMPLGIYADRVVSLAVIITLLTSLGLYATVLFLPLFFQVVLGLSTATSGNLLIPMLLGMVGGGVVAGQLLSRANAPYRLLALSGTVIMAVGMYLLSTMDRTTNIFLSISYVLFAGLGYGGIVATLSLAVQNSVPFAIVGAATSSLQFFRSLGGMLGLAVLGAVMTRNFHQTLDETIPDRVREMLPQGGLDTLKNSPVALDDRLVADSLKSQITQARPDGEVLANMLHDALVSAMSGTLSGVFAIVAMVTGVSIVGAFFFQVPPQPNSK